MKREKRAVRWKGWKRAFNSSFQAFSGVSCRGGRRRGGRENKNQRRERQAGVKTMQKKEVFLAIYSPYSKKSAFLEGVSGRIVRILWLFSTGPGSRHPPGSRLPGRQCKPDSNSRRGAAWDRPRPRPGLLRLRFFRAGEPAGCGGLKKE